MLHLRLAGGIICAILGDETTLGMTIGKKENDVWERVVTLLDSGIVAILMKGGPVMIPLLASSLISLTVILERL
jgi:hypothetical protein